MEFAKNFICDNCDTITPIREKCLKCGNTNSKFRYSRKERRIKNEHTKKLWEEFVDFKKKMKSMTFEEFCNECDIKKLQIKSEVQ